MSADLSLTSISSLKFFLGFQPCGLSVLPFLLSSLLMSCLILPPFFAWLLTREYEYQHFVASLLFTASPPRSVCSLHGFRRPSGKTWAASFRGPDPNCLLVFLSYIFRYFPEFNILCSLRPTPGKIKRHLFLLIIITFPNSST